MLSILIVIVSCHHCNPVDPPPPPPPPLSIASGIATIRPLGTGGVSSASITVSGAPGAQFQLSLSQFGEDGGHKLHSGTRPLGTLSFTGGNFGTTGQVTTTFTASHFGGNIKITATSGSESSDVSVLVAVENISELANGSTYIKIGEKDPHPSNVHHGTAQTLVGIILVANTYAEDFYTNLGLQQPVGDKLWINDLSLIKGGKYDLDHNWCISCSHSEHLVGTNVDVASNNVPLARKAAIEDIFRASGSPGFDDETADENHWHLRF